MTRSTGDASKREGGQRRMSTKCMPGPVVRNQAWRQPPRGREQNQSKGPAQSQRRHKCPGTIR